MINMKLRMRGIKGRYQKRRWMRVPLWDHPHCLVLDNVYRGLIDIWGADRTHRFYDFVAD